MFKLFPRVLLVFMLGLGAVLLSQRAGAATQVAAVDRSLEPVIRNGADLPNFVNAKLDDLFVFVYKDGAWSQIPFQVDERLPESDQKYVNDEGDGFIFDLNDEIVFMAKDLGQRSGGAGPMVGGQLVSSEWYEVHVTNPLNAAADGWAYVVRSSTLSPTFTGAYVSYDAPQKRIIGATYALGIDEARASVFGYLALGGSGSDILDRTPKVVGCLTVTICITEQNTGLLGTLNPIITDGPVRVVISGSGSGLKLLQVVGYESMASWTINVTSAFPPTTLRYSTDFSANAVGSTYYNQAVPAGVPVDGQNSSEVPATPYSPWWQLSTDNGTIVQVANLSSAGGTPTNYYEDDATQKPECKAGNPPFPGCDTGDGRRYADTGTRLGDTPNQSFTFPLNFYFLTGRQGAEAGPLYSQYFNQPLTVAAELIAAPSGNNLVYLPLVMRGE